MANLNILSQRYATPEINEIFSERGKILAERELWISVMKAQKELGLQIPSEDIEKYENSKADINLERIEEIERRTRHDIKAKIEAFVEVSGADEHLHKGMTSRDLTDNVEQMQIKKASQIIFGKYTSILKHFIEKADEYRHIELVARTHHQPAQVTLLGRRFAMWAEELLIYLPDFKNFIEDYKLRGIKGPVGTQADMTKLLGSLFNADYLDEKIAQSLDFSKNLHSTGQVYPRSLDFKLTSHLVALSSACENFAKGMRLMAGYGLVTEGFKEGQVGSSAMPHKMNTRSSERICGLSELIKMYNDGASRLSGDQWEEGDVSCSVVRRVIIPDTFYASDGLCETTLTVLNEMGVYGEACGIEVDTYLPFLATTQILMLAVEKGIGREKAHELIKRYGVNETIKMRNENISPRLVESLANDETFKKYNISERDIKDVLNDRKGFVGNAYEQINHVISEAEIFLEKHNEEANYQPRDIK